MNIRFQLIRQNRDIRAKKMNEKRRKEQIKRGVKRRLKKSTPVVDE